MITATRSLGDLRLKRGFTLTELIIAATLSGFLLVAVLSSFLYIGRSGQTLAAYSDLEAHGRRAMETFARDAREAHTVTWHSAHSLTFESGTGEPSATYTFDPSSGNLYRLTAGEAATTASPLAQNLANVAFVGYTVAMKPVAEFANLETDAGRSLAGHVTKHLGVTIEMRQTGGKGNPDATRRLSLTIPLLNRRLTS